ncbi:MAG: BamA/TamA family outer membrane protein [Gemmatimonadaceae bacterium]|nr:BamA/TamA family outer membrane protein [Gemmatimonadaceae bacterium]
MTRTRRPLAAAIALLCACALAWPAAAQVPDTLPTAAGVLPPSVSREAAARYNAPAALRVSTPTTIESGRVVDGDVASLEAPLTIAGVVRGNVTAINADVTLRAGARVDGAILVVGVVVAGLEGARVGGEVRAYQAALRFTREGESIVIDEPSAVEPLLSWMHFRDRQEAENGLRVRNYATYNRVEGLPIYGGPFITRRVPGGRVTAELFGVIRSADNFAWTSENIGHRATLEARSDGQVQLFAGGRLQDVVDAIESWQISNSEAALGSFLLHRDMRDWYSRLGGTMYVGVADARGASVTASLSDERWASRRERDPWTLFRDTQQWRPNPTIDDGRFHIFRLTGTLDTRNDPVNPRVGWYVLAELEHGTGEITSFGARSWISPTDGPLVPPRADSYRRGFLDLRRYNRVSPETQLNGRVVLAGWLGGDPLPIQRQLSLGGIGTLPGYDSREQTPGEDKLSCHGVVAAPGKPGECDRVALAQLEYRIDLGLERFRRNVVPIWYSEAAVVVFVDAGRGWRVDDRRDIGLGVRGGRMPPLNTFQSDVGAGVDLSLFGVYVAKAVSVKDEPLNVFVRLKHRF